MSNKEEMVVLEVVHITHTDNAVLLDYNGEEAWVPRSALGYRSDKDIDDMTEKLEFSCRMSEWIAREKGFI